MPRTCTICNHPKRAAIEAALVAGTSNRDITRQFGVEKDAVWRHRQTHLPATLLKAHKAREIARADTLLDRIETLYAKVEQVLQRAEAERTARGDMRILAAVREGRETAELLAKLAGQLREGATVNVLVAPGWVTVRTAVVEALVPFPKAQAAVATALGKLNGSG